MRRRLTPFLLLFCVFIPAGAEDGPARIPESALAIFPSGAGFELEIAADDASRQRGYMFREQVPPGAGMPTAWPRGSSCRGWTRSPSYQLR